MNQSSIHFPSPEPPTTRRLDRRQLALALLCCTAACTPMKELSSYSDVPASTAGASDAPAAAGASSDPAPPAANGGTSAGVDAGEPSAPASAAIADASDVGASTDAAVSSAPLACDATGELTTNDGGCYLLGAQAVGWAAASAACEAWGGTLARLDSAEEEAALLARVAPADVWIGLNDVASEGTMLWEAGGAPILYTHWAAQQPDDFDGTEDCVELLADGRGWNDRPCTDLRVYLCER